MAQLEARPVARISHMGTCPQALRSHIKEARTRDEFRNKISVCNNDVLHTCVATQIDLPLVSVRRDLESLESLTIFGSN